MGALPGRMDAFIVQQTPPCIPPFPTLKWGDTGGAGEVGMGSGTILNREHIGKTSDQHVEIWNTFNPGDPVVDVAG